MEIKITSSVYQYFTKLDSVIFPLNMNKFVQELANNGFKIILPGANSTNIPLQPGDFATKYNSILNINEQLMAISIIGTKFDDIVRMFNEAIPVCKSCGLDIVHTSRFFEFNGEMIIETGKKPNDTISKFLKNDHHGKFNEIFNTDTSISGFKLSSKDYNPNSTDFFDIRLEPLAKDSNVYFAHVIYRDKKREKIEQIMKNFEIKIKEFIEIIENS